MYAGTREKTHGERKDTTPARKASPNDTCAMSMLYSQLLDNNMSAVLHAGHRHIALVERGKRVCPAIDPPGILRQTVYAAVRTRHPEVVVPERRMDSIPVAAEKRGPRNSRCIVAGACRTAAHMDRNGFTPSGMFAQRGQVFRDRVAVRVSRHPGRHAAEIHFF